MQAMVSVTDALKPKVKSKLPPGPKGWPIIGNLPLPGADWLGGFERAARNFGDVVHFEFLNVPVILLVHPDAIESVLLKNPEKFLKSRDYRALKKVVGNGLLTSEGETWRRQRRMLQPAFRHENILAYSRIMLDCTERKLTSWRDGETRDLHQEMMSLTLQIVARALFGADVSHNVEQVGESLEMAMKEFTLIAGWAFLLPEKLPIPSTRRMRRARRALDDVLLRVIHERRAANESASQPTSANGVGQNERDDGDLLGKLLAMQNEDGTGLSDAELRDELMTLFLAGHETTAIALSWTWYLLAKHPRVLEKLRAELAAVLGGRTPSPEDLGRLRYTEMIIKESLRLYPPAWGIGRQAVEPFEAGGYTLPARTNIFILQWLTQRDARFFPEPLEFRPERWEQDLVREGKIPRFAYFPFGGGPRVCIGAGFATMELMLVLATVAQRFDFELVPDHPIELFPSVTLRPKHGIKAVLHEYCPSKYKREK